MPIKNVLPDIWRGGGTAAWSPFREMNRLQRRMDRMFDEMFSEPFGLTRLGRWGEPSMASMAEEFIPPCDVEETSTHYLLSFDLPGVKKDDVKIELRDHQLTVSGERKEEAQGKRSHERFYGAFSRSFTLPTDVSSEKVEANYENGVLQIAIPRSAAAQSKQIPIREGKMIEGKQQQSGKVA